MTLRELVESYRKLAGGFGRTVPLASFGLSPEETARQFSIFDEDYQISRFLHFTLATAVAKTDARTYPINGFPQSHLSVDAEIEILL